MSVRSARGDDETGPSGITVGTRVEVRDRFGAQWNRGFEVVDTTEDGYIVARVSDRYVLPAEFAARDVSPQNR